MTDAIRDQYHRDLEKSAENPKHVQAMIEQDFRNFHDRQPLYKAEIESRLKGNPDNIADTLPDIVY